MPGHTRRICDDTATARLQVPFGAYASDPTCHRDDIYTQTQPRRAFVLNSKSCPSPRVGNAPLLRAPCAQEASAWRSPHPRPADRLRARRCGRAELEPRRSWGSWERGEIPSAAGRRQQSGAGAGILRLCSRFCPWLHQCGATRGAEAPQCSRGSTCALRRRPGGRAVGNAAPSRRSAEGR